MANIQPRYNKEGKLISYSIRVHRGRGPDGKQLKPYTATFEVKPTWTEKSAKKKAEAFAATFEKECREGMHADTRQTFQQYAEYVLQLKEQTGVKHTTIRAYQSSAKRVYPAIGHIRITELRPQHLNQFYASLNQPGANSRTGGPLSPKSIKECNVFISTVLEQAVREGLVLYNAAHRATVPRQVKKEVQFFQPDEVAAIREALESEPLKWKTITHLLLITGMRRGELLGLKWVKVDFDTCTIRINNNVIYSPDRGIYETTPKTEKSRWTIALSRKTMDLLREYRIWQNTERLRLGDYYEDRDFVFAQDTGEPMHPGSVTTWLDRFSKRHGLPHINPHAFRHTMASILYFAGVDSVSISARLGHAQVSTTADIYAHVIEAADQKSADILGEIFLKKA